MLDPPEVTPVLSLARSRGADFAEVYVERWKRRALRVLNGEVKEATSGLEYGAGLRLFYGTAVAYAYSNDLTAAGLLDAADRLTRLQGRGGRVDVKGRGGLDFRRATAQGLHAPAVPFDRHPPADVGRPAGTQAMTNLQAKPAPAESTTHYCRGAWGRGPSMPRERLRARRSWWMRAGCART